ncbi:hypothetical protein [Arsenophonus nasoniae]|uniref:Uncharacterized protein n=1 Tax=Arsenophonus nasoniae TaxID=638 RepID=A0AA95GLA5_9GAMM|nr:hypothetical protein [Arsenophonus nasoniae]WGL96341.1 hypothetical protein QE207_07220 [Arsenophonus nasoniae]WGM00591.1 hypothetical protein QE210_12050 [Arsenophonus nasoniae]
MNYSVKYGLLILSISYMISILFPSMAMAANDKKDKQYMCHGWHGYPNKEMNLFDQPVTAANEDNAKLLAMKIIGKDLQASSDANQKIHTQRCDELSAH